ncbi:MAG: hypothetical protein ABIE70_05450 [bacterium]
MFLEKASAQQLSTNVYPSEDELLEAVREGDLSYAQYLRLQQIIGLGIDSLTAHWLDELPNQDALRLSGSSFYTDLDRQQQAPFLARSPGRSAVNYEFAQQVDDEGVDRYRLSCRLEPCPGWQAAARVHREFAGYERCTYRSLRYTPNKPMLQMVTLGNFSTRLGLGTAVGHRGQILSPERQLSTESWLVPDYAGFNGLHAVSLAAGMQTSIIVSADRDEDFRHLLLAVSTARKSGSWQPMVTVAFNRLDRHASSDHHDDTKISPGLRYGYRQGMATVEFCWQQSWSSRLAAVVAEGRHRFGVAEIRYAGWIYADHYRNFSGGSKSANLVRELELSEIGLVYSDRRSGQEGLYLKAVTLLSPESKLVTSLVYGSLNQDTSLVQVLTGLEVSASQATALRLDYLDRSRRGQAPDGLTTHRRRSRLELRWHRSDLALRSYLAYNTETKSRDFMSWFLGVKFDSKRAGSWEGWLNVGRVDHTRGRVDYWYGFLRLEQRLYRWLSTYAKFTHSYRRPSSVSSTMILGVQASW